MESYRTRHNQERRYLGGNGNGNGNGLKPALARTQNGVSGRAAAVGTQTTPAVTGNSILQKLDPHQHKRLFRALRRVDLTKDQFLYQQGQKLEFVYFPETAVLSKFHILEDGRTIEVDITGKEGALGVTSVFNSLTAINCVQVCVTGSAFKVERDVVQSEAVSSRILNDLLCEQICLQLTNLSQKVICNTFHHVEQRLSTWLLMLDERCSGDYLSVTQEHIARVLGVHRPSVTYIAQEMRNKKLIEYVRGRIYIRDRKGLEETACICYSEMRAGADIG